VPPVHSETERLYYLVNGGLSVPWGVGVGQASSVCKTTAVLPDQDVPTVAAHAKGQEQMYVSSVVGKGPGGVRVVRYSEWVFIVQLVWHVSPPVCQSFGKLQSQYNW
jgi:hypothetical protein